MGDRADQSTLEARWTDAVATGDFTGARSMLPDLRASFRDVRGFELELDAARWLAGRSGAALPRPEDIAQLTGRTESSALARAASFCTRAAVLRFDASALSALHDTLRTLATTTRDAETLVRMEVAHTWSSLFHGDHADAATGAAEATRRARAASVGAAVVQLQAAQALIALGEGDLDAATAAARRAVRMARSESIPPDELLANIVLARVRRVSGAPHLAQRILLALRDLASPPFLRWLDYELVLAGAPRRPERTSTPAAALSTLLTALAAAQPEAVDAAAESLRAHTDSFADAQSEVDDLLAALGASDRSRVSPAMSAWLTGEAHVVPRGLHAVATSPTVVAYVAAHPDHGSIRLLAPAMFPWGHAPRKQIEPGRRPQERTDAAIALLAMRGAPPREEEFFQELYGFPYRPSLHASVLSTLLHRVRATLGDAATLHRDDGLLRLELHTALIAWDPRCQRPLEDRILAVLTQRGASTAKAAADRLGIPLRTVQAALGHLVEGGACKRDRQGRNVEYTVEDTTFSEPTVTRARAWREDPSR